MMIPEDGCYRTPPSSDLNAFNNIMVVRVGNLKKTYETNFQLATLDRSKEGTEWPADEYVDQLIPSLPKIKICDEQLKAFESRKELDLTLPLKTKAPRPKLFCESEPNRYHFKLEENIPNRFQSKPEIPKKDYLLPNPWENQSSNHNGRNMTRSTSPSDRHFSLPNNNFTSFCPTSTHRNFSGAPPSSNNSFQNGYSEGHFSSRGFNKNKRNPRNVPKSKNFHKKKYPPNKSNQGSRHVTAHIEPYNYVEDERGNSPINSMITPGYYPNNLGRVPHISPESRVLDSRQDSRSSSFKGNYMEVMDNSVMYDGMQRINSNKTHQALYSTRNGREQWRNNTFNNPRQDMNLNPRDMNLNPRESGNSMSRGKRNQRKPWGNNRRQPRY